MKQTAVEWLESIIKHCERFGTNVEQKDIDQAKEMEKQQITDAYRFGLEDDYVIGSREYYNKTFK
jgi:hypothetical protein